MSEFIVGELDVLSWQAKYVISPSVAHAFQYSPPEVIKQSDIFHHYAVFFNNTQFEITGRENNCVNEETMSIIQFKNSHEVIISIKVPSNSTVNTEAIKTYMKKWVERYPKYSLGYANCQKFAKDVAYDLFGLKIFTQTERYWWYGTIFIIIGVVIAMLIAFKSVELGFYIIEQGKILDKQKNV
jgi:hypothetical protein